MACKGVGEGVEGIIVDWDGGDRGGEAMSAALPSKDCDFEASLEELIEDGWPEVASGLRENLLSIPAWASKREYKMVSLVKMLRVCLPQPKRPW